MPGNRVLLRAPNTPDAGRLLARRSSRPAAIVVATMPLLRARELDEGGRQGAGHATRSADARLAAEVRDGACRAPVLCDAASIGALEQLTAAEDVGFERCDTAADDVALIAFTSGTTGDAEGLRALPPRRARRLRHVPAPRPRPAPDDVFSGSPPLAFTFGLGGLVLFPLRFGASTVAGRAGPGRTRCSRRSRELRRHDAVHGADRVSRDARAAPADRCARCARASRPASRCRPASRRLVRDDRHPDHRRHRLDRDAAHLHQLRRGRGAARLGRHGRCPATRRGSSTTACEPVAPGEVGRLAVRGPTGCRYLDDPRQGAYVRDGWNLTGDASAWTPTATSGTRRGPTT